MVSLPSIPMRLVPGPKAQAGGPQGPGVHAPKPGTANGVSHQAAAKPPHTPGEDAPGHLSGDEGHGGYADKDGAEGKPKMSMSDKLQMGGNLAMAGSMVEPLVAPLFQGHSEGGATHQQAMAGADGGSPSKYEQVLQ